jgi:hypothetical protein
MPPTFGSGATLDANGQVISVVDVQPADPPEPPVPDAPEPDAGGDPAQSEPEPPAEPAEEEEAAVVEQARANRPFVARVIRENERLKRDNAAQAAQLEYFTRQLTQSQAPPQSQPEQVQSPVPDPTRPRAEYYATHEDYIEALTDWKYDQRERQREAQLAQQREASQRQTAQQQWEQRETEGRDTYEDYDEVVGRLTLRPNVAPIVADTFRESEQGAALLYYLGTHPKDMQRLNTLSPLAAARWLGQLEAQLAAPGSVRSNGATSPSRARTLGAPPTTRPLQPVRGGGTEPVIGFRSGMPLLEYQRMRDRERERTP